MHVPGEMQPRCSRDAAERQPRGGREAAERQPRGSAQRLSRVWSARCRGAAVPGRAWLARRALDAEAETRRALTRPPSPDGTRPSAVLQAALPSWPLRSSPRARATRAMRRAHTWCRAHSPHPQGLPALPLQAHRGARVPRAATERRPGGAGGGAGGGGGGAHSGGRPGTGGAAPRRARGAEARGSGARREAKGGAASGREAGGARAASGLTLRGPLPPRRTARR